MTDDAKTLSQQQFGAHAQGYVSSPAHAKGYSLDRLVELVVPKPGQRALDLATGGGHTALALARHGAATTAADITFPMLQVAREHINTQLAGAGLCTFARMDAERLPFPANHFDIVTCRIAAHHFPDVARFVRECARVVRPGGVVAVIDQLSPGEPKPARYINNFEKLRDPSHNWTYNRVEWESFFAGAGLQVTHYEDFDTRHALTPWAERMGCDADTITRLRVMLQQAPAPVAEWVQPTPMPDGDIAFVIRQFLLIGHHA